MRAVRRGFGLAPRFRGPITLAGMSAGQTGPAAVELRSVSRSFGAVRAVDGIDLRLELG